MVEADTALLLLINTRWVCPFADGLMLLLSSETSLIPVLVVLLAYVFYKDWRKGLLVVFGIAVAVAIVDPLAARILKPWVARVRPCHELADQVRTLTSCGGEFCFPSNHAANMAAMATVIGCRFPRLLVVGVPVALAVAYSRVYLGVHYPLDVVAGLVLGAVVGLGASGLLTHVAGFARRAVARRRIKGD
jgi:undecaprenyl-diphosphatase